MRVVALTPDASLAVALSMIDGWEIVDVGDVEEACRFAPDASAVIIGIGTTADGIEAAELVAAKGSRAPVVVVGDTVPTDPTTVTVLTRPFTIDDIRGTVERVVGSARSTEHSASPVRSVPGADEPVVETESEEAPVEPLPADVPVQPHATEEDLPDLSLVEFPAPPEEVEPEPEQPEAAEPVFDTLEPVAEMGRGSNAPEREPEPIPSEAVVGPAAAQRTAQDLPLSRDVASGVPEPRSDSRWRRGGRRRVEPQPGIERAPERIADDSVPARMREATRSLEAVAELLTEMPALADPAAIANALVDEITASFPADSCSIHLRGLTSFRVISAHNLSKVEEGMRVPLDQSLFHQLCQTQKAMLIAPVDLARGFLVGVPGVHAEALIATTVVLDGDSLGIILISGPDFTETDLDRLDDLARQAAPGIGFARALDQVRSL